MFDLHLIHAIKNLIKYFNDHQDFFNSCFSDVSPAIRTKYYTRLNDLILQLQYDAAFTKKTDKTPLITVSLNQSEAETTDSILGNAGHGGNKVMLIGQECGVNIYAKSMEDLRILHTLIIHGLLLFKSSFFDTNYLDMRYVQSTDLEPIESLTSDNVIIYQRQMIYSAVRQIEVKAILPDNAFDLPWKLDTNLVQN